MTIPRPRPKPRTGRPATGASGARPAAAHRPVVPRPRPPFDETAARDATIYKIPTYEIHPRTGMILLYDEAGRRTGQVASLDLPHQGSPRMVFDYVGQTVRPLMLRDGEHDEDKCWADVKAGRAMLVEQGCWTKAERDAREIAAIGRLKPRFNYDHNLLNPNRIEMWRQVELRHARDRAAGQSLWIPLEQRTAAAAREAVLNVMQGGLDGREPRYPAVVAWDLLCGAGRFLRGLPLGLQLAGLYLVVWVLLSAAGLMLLTGTWGWPQSPAIAASTMAAALLVGAVPGSKRRRRRRRR